MTASVLPAVTLDELFGALGHTSAFIELGVVMGCLAGAWVIVRLIRGPVVPKGSIWFGRRIVDGVLFPALALALAYAARRVLLGLGVPVAVFKIAVPVLLSFAVIRLSVRVLSAAFPDSRLMRVAERTISWVAWLAVVGWLTGLLPVVLEELDAIHWKMGGTDVSVRSLIEGALSAGAVLVLVLWVSSAIEARLLKDMTGSQLSLRKAAANAVRALLLFVGLLLALTAVGIDLTALSVLGGAVGVGLGLGLQRLAANYVSGFVILAERSVRIGDLVRVAGYEGRITDITTRYTVVRSAAGGEAIVPNETLVTTPVENLSLADPNVLLTTAVSVAYGTDVHTLRERIAAAVGQVERVLADPPAAAHLTAFGADGLELTVFFWVRDPENGQANVRSAVNLAILALFDDLGIEIPFPQRVLRMEAGGLAAPLQGPVAGGEPGAASPSPR